MFSSSLLTADSPPSQVKAGNMKASPALLAEDSAASHEEGGTFAKEFQAVASEEQKVKTNQQVKSIPQAELEGVATLVEGAESELQLSDSEIPKSEKNDTVTAEPDGDEASKLLIHNSENDVDVSTSQTAGQQNVQISASQKADDNAELDSAKKQQIMNDGEALLNRLSESNKQLAPAQASAAADIKEGKTLPLEPTASAVAAGALKPVQTKQLMAQVETAHLQTQQVPSEQTSIELVSLAQQPVSAGGKAAVTEVDSQNLSESQDLTQTELQQGILPAAVFQGDSPDQATMIDNTASTEAQAAGISREELAKVFAAPVAQASSSEVQFSQKQLSKEPLSQEQISEYSTEHQVGKQMNSDAELSNDNDKAASEPDGGMMATPFALGAAASPAGTEVKSIQPIHQQPSELLQSASPKTAEMVKEQQVSADLLDSKGKASSVFMPSAATVTATAAANISSGQPLLSDANQAPAMGAGTPTFSLAPAASTVTSDLLSPNAGTVEAQLTSSAGIAAGTAAMATALEQGAMDSSSEVKSADLTHSLTGLTTQQGQATAQARAEAALAQSPLQLSKEQAGDQLAERVQVMMSKNLKHVDIRLDPPELGKLQIKLSLNQDQASVQFTVGNQQTRDLVEQAMPRLRELLNQQGLQLAQSSVQQDSSRQQFAGQSNQQQNQNNAGQQSNGSGQQNSGGSQHQQAEMGGSDPVDMYVSQPTDRVDYYA